MFETGTILIYRDCQKNVPIEDRFSATTPYAAILFLQRYYDKRYKTFTSGGGPGKVQPAQWVLFRRLNTLVIPALFEGHPEPTRLAGGKLFGVVRGQG